VLTVIRLAQVRFVGHIARMGHGGGVTPRGIAEPAMTRCTGRRSILTATWTPTMTGVEDYQRRLYNMLGGAVDVYYLGAGLTTYSGLSAFPGARLLKSLAVPNASRQGRPVYAV
jgi:hypothetical protein